MGTDPQDRSRAPGKPLADHHAQHAASRRSVLIDVGESAGRAEGDPLRASSRTGLSDFAGRLAWALARFPEVWVLLLPGLYTALAVLSPWLRARGYVHAGEILFALYRGWCHQLPQRTLFLESFPMAICARCFAIGAGFAIGSLFAGRISDMSKAPRRVRVSFLALCVGAVPMFLDGFTQLLGFRESTNTLRVATGGLFGLCVAFWVVPTLYDAFDELRRNPRDG